MRAAAGVAVASWIILAASGTVALLARETREAPRRVTPDAWPSGTHIQRAPHRATLLMFVHPNCPCTRASVSRLMQIISALPAASRPQTIFVARPAAEKDWRAEWLTSMAASVPDSIIVRDAHTIEANRFGAATSGHVLLYEADGMLSFDGGITLGRGHEGDNAAADALRRALSTSDSATAETAVFGCAIDNKPPRAAR
jgi:hypothetical protein